MPLCVNAPAKSKLCASFQRVRLKNRDRVEILPTLCDVRQQTTHNLKCFPGVLRGILHLSANVQSSDNGASDVAEAGRVIAVVTNDWCLFHAEDCAVWRSRRLWTKDANRVPTKKLKNRKGIASTTPKIGNTQ